MLRLSEMTNGEIGLVLFIFGLVYSAGYLKRIGDRVGEMAFSEESKAQHVNSNSVESDDDDDGDDDDGDAERQSQV